MSSQGGQRFLLPIYVFDGEDEGWLPNIVQSSKKHLEVNRHIQRYCVWYHCHGLSLHYVNKGKHQNYTSEFEVMKKYWGKIYYKPFYQMDEVISLNKFFQHTGIIV